MLRLMLSFILLAATFRSAGESFPLAYLVEANLSVQYLHPGTTNVYLQRSGIATFVQTNGWWEVEIKYLNPGKNHVRLENSKRIPDGIRSYFLFEADTRAAMTTATACPVNYPTSAEAFGCWLSFAAKPSLPFLDEKRMRRMLNLPDCQADLINSPQNEGYYSIHYLPSEKEFVSSLQLTNNGTDLDIEVTASGLENRITKLGRPFLEFTHELLATTNFGGQSFPSHVVEKLYRPLWTSGDNYQQSLVMRMDITLNRIESASENLNKRKPLSRLFGLDVRPNGLRKEETVNYIVDNDVWKPLLDPEISWRTKMVKQQRP